MDPTTVIIILGIHLVSSGGLMFLIGRQMPPHGGLGRWASGAMLFGAAYLGRLVGGLNGTQWWLALIDSAMIAAAVLFITGLHQFIGRRTYSGWSIAAVALAYAALEAGVTAVWGGQGRHAVLNLCLAALYALLSGTAVRALPRQPPDLRPPLTLLAALIGGLSLLTLLRASYILGHGSQSVYAGLHAQIFYVYASISAVLLALILLWMVFVRINGQLTEMALGDALTQVFNRNGLEHALQRHFAARFAPALTLMLVDLDHFKRVNDDHGHAVGDTLLKAVAQALAQEVRGSDFVARVGGEEFIVGCAGSAGDAAALGERLCAAVRAIALPGPVTCTASVGVSHPMTRLEDTARAWREADMALYAAKAAGRDRVVLAADDTPDLPHAPAGAGLPA